MSYDIIYSKQFVKLRRTREVIPILLSGSNNCYEIGRGGRDGRRARDWNLMTYYNRKGKISEKPEIILKNLDAELRKYIRNRSGKNSTGDKAKPSDIRNRWGWYAAVVVGSGNCGSTSWNKWYGVFANGIKQALTIEELGKLGITLNFFASCTSPNGYPPSIPLKNEQDYFAELKKWREWKDNNQKGFYLTFGPSDDIVLKRLRASKHRTPAEKVSMEQDHYFVLTDGSSSLIKYTRRGYRYSYGKEGGKKFRTQKDAEKYRDQLLSKKRYKADTWKVERIDRPCTFLVAS
jgi:predicted DNA-binding WGR domain protein